MTDPELPTVLSSADRRLIHALQIAPRASWSEVGRLLGLDPVTVSRHWQRLRSTGVAWVTAYAATEQVTIALVEIECPPGRTLEIAESLAEDPEAQTIDLTAGGRDILLTVNCRSPEHLTNYVLQEMSSLTEIRSLRTHLLNQIVRDARSWQLRALSPDEQAAAQRLERPTQAVPQAAAQTELEAAILAELARDGRATATALANRLSVSPDRTRAALKSALESGRVVVRTEVARPYSGRPAYAWYFLRTPARMVDEVVSRLSSLSDVRLLARSVGAYNIVMAMWLKSLDDIQRLEVLIDAKVPEAGIVDRSLVLRTPKHLGRRLTPEGLNTGQMIGSPFYG